MKRSVWVVIAIVIVVAVGAVAFMKHGQSASTASTTSPSSSNNAAGSNQPAATTIDYTSSGFSQADTTVKAGDAVTFKNQTSEDIQVDSNPHPVHTDDTDLNVGPIGPGASKTVILTKKGTFGFHNHLDPSDTAKITIQ